MSRLIALVAQECVKSKQAQNCRPSYVAQLAHILQSFSRGRELRDIATVTIREIETWLAETTCHPGTRNTLIGRLSTLFGYAVDVGHIEHNPLRRIKKARTDWRAPRILSPGEARMLLAITESQAPPLLLSTILGLFSGIRQAELRRLHTDFIEVERGFVRIEADVSKIRSRRIVRLEPIALQWLRRTTIEKGQVLPADPRWHRAKVMRALNWPSWDRNILRHSAASYLLALYQDPGKVAFLLGHSPATLMKHYAELVSPEDCARFWACEPAQT